MAGWYALPIARVPPPPPNFVSGGPFMTCVRLLAFQAAVYTPEQQQRLGVDEEGEPVNSTGQSSTGYQEEFTVVDIPKRNAERAAAKADADRAAAKAKARTRFKVAGTVAKASVRMPMGGLFETHRGPLPER